MRDLTPLDTALRTNSPPLQGRGRGWGLSAGRLDVLHERAADMRRNPTEPEKRLWRSLSASQLQGHKFRRQAVIGRFIVDFVCPRGKLIVEVDGDTHDARRDRTRDGALADTGYQVLRFSNDDVMNNLRGVLERIADALHLASGPHPNPSPEGEGLFAGAL